MNTWSSSASGNFSGSFVVSMSNAHTRTSPRASRSGRWVKMVSPADARTSYHHPHRVSVSMSQRTWYGTSYSRMSIMASA